MFKILMAFLLAGAVLVCGVCLESGGAGEGAINIPVTSSIGDSTVNFARKILIDPAGTYAYLVTETAPSYVAKVRLSDFTLIGVKALETGKAFSAAMDSAGEYLYVGMDTKPGKIIRLSLADFTTTATKTFDAKDDRVYAVTIDHKDEYLYAGLATDPGRIVRLSLSDFKTTSTKTLSGGARIVCAMDIDPKDKYIYAVGWQSPCKITRVLLSDFETMLTKELAIGEDFGVSLVVDPSDTYVYVGCYTAPAKIVRVNIADMTKTATKTFAAGSGQDNAHTMTIDAANNAMWVGFSNLKPVATGKIGKVAIRSAWADAPYTTTALEYAENIPITITLDPSQTYLYAGLFTSPAKIVKLQASDIKRVACVDCDNTFYGWDKGQGTIAFWFKPEKKNARLDDQVLLDTSPDEDGISLGYRATAGPTGLPGPFWVFFPAIDRGYKNFIEFNAGPAVGKLTHILVDWDFETNSVRLFQDNIHAGARANNLPGNWVTKASLNGKQLHIGGNPRHPDRDFKGKIYDVSMYNRRLTDAERALLYKKKHVDKGCVLHYNFIDNGADNTVHK